MHDLGDRAVELRGNDRIDRDRFMSAAEARDYGIIDDIILPRRGLCAPGTAAAEPELQAASA